MCVYVALARETGDAAYLARAEALVADVHATLGRDRRGAPLGTADAPLSGGLRIGKVHDEGHPDGDGQYMHYLTKWALALNRLGLAVGGDEGARYNALGVQLLKAAHRHFVWATPGGALHMRWKMSVDLRTPAVLSEGNLDAFDCLATYRLLQEHAPRDSPHTLHAEIADMESMVRRKVPTWTSGDALDLGEALQVAAWHPGEAWSRVLTERSLDALELLWRGGAFQAPRRARLAFREFGTAIGVQVNPRAPPEWRGTRVRELLATWKSSLFDRDADITPIMFAVRAVIEIAACALMRALYSLRCCRPACCPAPSAAPTMPCRPCAPVARSEADGDGA